MKKRLLIITMTLFASKAISPAWGISADIAKSAEAAIAAKAPVSPAELRKAVYTIVSRAKAKIQKNNSKANIDRIMSIAAYYSQQVVFMSSIEQVSSLVNEATKYMNNNTKLPSYVTSFNSSKIS